jgi:hypothetical protein
MSSGTNIRIAESAASKSSSVRMLSWAPIDAGQREAKQCSVVEGTWDECRACAATTTRLVALPGQRDWSADYVNPRLPYP